MTKAIFSSTFSLVYWIVLYVSIDWVQKHHASMSVFKGGTAMELSIMGVALTALAFVFANNQWRK